MGLKDMPKIRFLPSGMPTGKAAPAKPRNLIRSYIREAEHRFDWLKSPEDRQDDGKGNKTDTTGPAEA